MSKRQRCEEPSLAPRGVSGFTFGKIKGQGMVGSRKRIWGWYFFDWASQPYNTLLITFIFGPYVSGLLGDGTAAQAAWGYGLGAAGMVVAVLAPLLGSIADRTGAHMRMRFIWLFSALYVIGAWALWYAAPGSFNLPLTLAFFGLGAAQVLVCCALLSGVAILGGLPPAAAVIGASGFVLSSTAVIMKMLDELGPGASEVELLKNGTYQLIKEEVGRDFIFAEKRLL